LSRKRSTMLLNKLMSALQKAMEKDVAARHAALALLSRPVSGEIITSEEDQEDDKGDNELPLKESLAAVAMPSVAQAYQLDLQRRGEGKQYWRCYFNAVSCF